MTSHQKTCGGCALAEGSLRDIRTRRSSKKKCRPLTAGSQPRLHLSPRILIDAVLALEGHRPVDSRGDVGILESERCEGTLDDRSAKIGRQ